MHKRACLTCLNWYVKTQFPFHALVPINIPKARTTGTCLYRL